MQEKTTIADNDPIEHMLQRSHAPHEQMDAVLGDRERPMAEKE